MLNYYSMSTEDQDGQTYDIRPGTTIGTIQDMHNRRKWTVEFDGDARVTGRPLGWWNAPSRALRDGIDLVAKLFQRANKRQ